jgi:hypothetical protein
LKIKYGFAKRSFIVFVRNEAIAPSYLVITAEVDYFVVQTLNFKLETHTKLPKEAKDKHIENKKSISIS